LSDLAPRFSPDIERRFEAALARSRGDRAVFGVDIGFVYDRRGQMTGVVDVRVHRRASGAIGPVAKISALLSPARKLSMNRGDGDTIGPGARIANVHCTLGTLGLVVFDANTNQPLIMSSSHVFGSPTTSSGAAIHLVPAGTATPRAIATFSRAVNDVTGDAAVAEPAQGVTLRCADQRGTVVMRAAMPELGDIVEKVGAATGRTAGVVDGLGRYFLSGTDGMLGFRIVLAAPNDSGDISQPGDSGAAWYRPADHVGVGLHVGGDQSVAHESRQPAIACYLPLVLEALCVNLTRTDERLPNGQRR
jgi:hypothetical protein